MSGASLGRPAVGALARCGRYRFRAAPTAYRRDPEFVKAFLARWARLQVVEVSASGDRGFVQLREPGQKPGTVPLVREGGRWRLDFEPWRK